MCRGGATTLTADSNADDRVRLQDFNEETIERSRQLQELLVKLDALPYIPLEVQGGSKRGRDQATTRRSLKRTRAR